MVSQSRERQDAPRKGTVILLSSFTIMKASGIGVGYLNATRALRHDFREMQIRKRDRVKRVEIKSAKADG